MDAKTFAAFFGPLIGPFNLIKKYFAHPISAIGAVFFFYNTFFEHINNFGLGDIFFFVALGWVLTLAAPFMLEYLHFYLPATFFRMLYQPRKYLTSFRGAAMFVLVAAMLYGATWFSQTTSSEGGVMAAKYRKETAPQPEKVNLASDSATYVSTLSELRNSYDERIEAKRAAKAAAKKTAIAPYDAKIRDLEAVLRGHKQDKARGNAWAASWIDKRTNQIRAAEAEKASAFANAGLHIDAEIATIQDEKATTLLALTSEWKDKNSHSDQIYKSRVSEFNETMANLATFGHGIGWWVVILIIALDAVIIFYEVHSGREYKGVEWKPSGKVARWRSAAFGVVADKADHLLVRTEATRKELSTRNEAKPFSLPTGSQFSRAFAVGLILIAGMQLPEITGAAFAQFSFVPHPWNWPFALFAVVWGVLAYGPDFRKSVKVQESRTVTVADPVTKSVTNPLETQVTDIEKATETVVGRGVTDITPYDVSVTTPEEITRLETYLRVNYDRIHIAETDFGKASARIKFEDAKDKLEDIGYKFTFGPDKKTKTITQKDKPPKTVTYLALHKS